MLCGLSVMLLIGASGCFMNHGDPPAPAPDSSVSPAPDAAPLPPRPSEDAGPPPVTDAGPTPAVDAAVPTGCVGPSVPHRGTRTTVEVSGFGGMALPADEAFDLPVSIDGACFCGEQVVCEVNMMFPGTGPALIDLTTSICDGSLLCDGCYPHVDGLCRVPALPAGDYRVRLNGEEGFLLSLPVWRTDSEEQVCFTPAPPVSDHLFCPWETTSIVDVAQLCVPPEVFANTSSVVTVTDGCGGCFDGPADCVVTQQGHRLIVDARTRTCDCPTCGACDDGCVPVETECRLPPLAPGTYTVAAGGFETTIEVVEGGPGGELPPAPTRCANPHG
ncbi:MAG: hypothetical protein DRJ42_23025 [Deltaproteobacteria bacterium]|nr:MAG: hypothetical protein DRJ42_23025 [Deltaproteobacteria bacterium]